MTDESNHSIPDKNTSQWKKNEKTINENPVLKQARDTVEGLEKPAHKYSSTSITASGAGDPRYAEGWERIFGKKKKDEEK